jgi:cell division protein FtsI (penicillin-binding protein 3)
MSRPLDFLFRDRPAKRRPRRRHKLPVAPSVPRLRVLLIVVAVIFSLAAGRAVQVQAIDANTVAAEAAEQMTVSHVLPAFRGEITDRNGEVLAMTQDTVWVIASPRSIATNGRMQASSMTDKDRQVAATAPQRIADLLAQFCGGTPADYLGKLTVANSGYQIVARGVASATYRALSEAMTSAGLVGLSQDSKPTRTYPNGTLASNVLGWVNDEGVGASGLEYALNRSLSGTPGKEVYESSPSGEKIPLGDNATTPAINGQGVQTTLDADLNWQADQLIADQVRKTKADWGAVIITNVKTGEVLTLSNAPSFDSNDHSGVAAKDLGNRAVTDAYTPGSVEKTLTFSALIDQGLVDPDEVVSVPGKIKSGDNWVRDAWSHGTIKLYARGIVAESSNIGTIKVARRATKQSLYNYVTSFGLGARTKIGLPGEATGSIPSANMPDYTRDGLAFGGSGVTVTLPQMAAAVGAIANGGVYVPLQLIKSRTLADGTVQQTPPGPSHRVIKTDTASKVLSMMEAMAQNSPVHRFDVAGYRVGAKTGTSKILDPKTGRTTGLVTSAISVAPIEDPQILVYVVVSNPQRGSAGSSVAGPVVQQLMSLALPRYAVPQSTTKAPKLTVAP